MLRDSNGDGRADVSRSALTGLREDLRGVHGLAVRGDRLYMVTETELLVSGIQEDGSLTDPDLLQEIPAGGQTTEPPVLAYIAHAAPMQMVFDTADHFPTEYRNDAFATMRGSWNRNPPIGYEVVRIRFDAAGTPTAMETFVRGWLIEGGRAHFGRLMGLAMLPDGSLLVGDDTNGVIYRISYGS